MCFCMNLLCMEQLESLVLSYPQLFSEWFPVFPLNVFKANKCVAPSFLKSALIFNIVQSIPAIKIRTCSRRITSFIKSYMNIWLRVWWHHARPPRIRPNLSPHQVTNLILLTRAGASDDRRKVLFNLNKNTRCLRWTGTDQISSTRNSQHFPTSSEVKRAINIWRTLNSLSVPSVLLWGFWASKKVALLWMQHDLRWAVRSFEPPQNAPPLCMADGSPLLDQHHVCCFSFSSFPSSAHVFFWKPRRPETLAADPRTVRTRTAPCRSGRS